MIVVATMLHVLHHDHIHLAGRLEFAAPAKPQNLARTRDVGKDHGYTSCP
jgi:hypothetical protein